MVHGPSAHATTPLLKGLNAESLTLYIGPVFNIDFLTSFQTATLAFFLHFLHSFGVVEGYRLQMLAKGVFKLLFPVSSLFCYPNKLDRASWFSLCSLWFNGAYVVLPPKQRLTSVMITTVSYRLYHKWFPFPFSQLKCQVICLGLI